MVSAFGDESADETQQRTFAVAAIVASDEEWKDLTAQWVDRTGGIPFHATDCESDKGVYRGKSHSENKALYVDLVKMLSKSDAWGFGAAFDLGSYRDIFPSVDQDVCYLRALLVVIGFFEKFAQTHYEDVIKFTFDSRERSNYSAGKIYDLAVNDRENRFIFDEISFASSYSSKKPITLEIADLFAYETMRELDNRIAPTKRERRKSMLALGERGHFGCDVFLREYFEDMQKKLGELGQRDPTFTFESYLEWLSKYKNGVDSPRNRLLYFIWFGERERRVSRRKGKD